MRQSLRLRSSSTSATGLYATDLCLRLRHAVVNRTNADVLGRLMEGSGWRSIRLYLEVLLMSAWYKCFARKERSPVLSLETLLRSLRSRLSLFKLRQLVIDAGIVSQVLGTQRLKCKSLRKTHKYSKCKLKFKKREWMVSSCFKGVYKKEILTWVRKDRKQASRTFSLRCSEVPCCELNLRMKSNSNRKIGSWYLR